MVSRMWFSFPYQHCPLAGWCCSNCSCRRVGPVLWFDPGRRCDRWGSGSLNAFGSSDRSSSLSPFYPLQLGLAIQIRLHFSYLLPRILVTVRESVRFVRFSSLVMTLFGFRIRLAATSMTPSASLSSLRALLLLSLSLSGPLSCISTIGSPHRSLRQPPLVIGNAYTFFFSSHSGHCPDKRDSNMPSIWTTE